MKRILYSASTLIFVGAIMAGATGAFFSDTETSSGNTFTAGALDLKIDNTSYYNGAPNASTTWALTDLTIQKFFDFPDLKPGDRGEDTISLHVNNNDAYLCANVKLTSNDDNGYTEPELLDDPSVATSTGGPGLGELAGEVNFIMWPDDGDNVLETNEHVLYQGPIGALGNGGSTTIPLADSQVNIWGTPGPAPGGVTQYIGKAWCFGTFGSTTATSLPQDGLGSTSPRTPGNSTGGISCDGSTLGNEAQTDSLTADVTFTAVQARNNARFVCGDGNTGTTTTLTVIKLIKNNDGGNNVINDFHLFVFDGFVSHAVVSGATTTLNPGNYNVSETGVSGYAASFDQPGNDCDNEGNVTLNPGDHKTCYLTNDDLPAVITLTKNVINHGGTATSSQFMMRVDGGKVNNTTSTSTKSNTPHFITEDPFNGYHFVSITGAGCPAATSTPVVLNEGESISCIITNEQNQ